MNATLSRHNPINQKTANKLPSPPGPQHAIFMTSCLLNTTKLELLSGWVVENH